MKRSEAKERNSSVLAEIKLRDKDNPIYSCELEKKYGISGVMVRNIVREARRNGVPIAESCEGYHLAKNRSEIEETIQDLKLRAESMLNTARALENHFYSCYYTDGFEAKCREMALEARKYALESLLKPIEKIPQPQLFVTGGIEDRIEEDKLRSQVDDVFTTPYKVFLNLNLNK